MTRFYRMFVLLLFFCAYLSFGNSTASAAQPSERAEKVAQWGEWETARNFYDSQRFRDALQSLQTKPLDNANYYYNLGTIYYKLTELGPAVAYLEKANRLRPHDSDIRYNLSIARSFLGQAIGTDKLDSASNGLEQLADQVSLNEVRFLLGFLGMLILLAWLRAYLNTRSIRKMFITPLGNMGLVGFILTTCVFGLQKWASATPPAVSIQRHSVRSGPGERYSELARLEAGTKLRLLPTSTESSTELSANAPGTPDKTETWQQVRYSGDGIGWVKISSLLVL